MCKKRLPIFLENFYIEKRKYKCNTIPFEAVTARNLLDIFTCIEYKLFVSFLNDKAKFTQKLESENPIYRECVEELMEVYNYFANFLTEIENIIEKSESSNSIFADLSYNNKNRMLNFNGNNILLKKFSARGIDKEFLVIKLILKNFVIKNNNIIKDNDSAIKMFLTEKNSLIPLEFYRFFLDKLFYVCVDDKSEIFPKFKYYKNVEFFDAGLPGFQKRSIDNLLEKLKKSVSDYKEQVIKCNNIIANRYPKLMNFIMEQSLLISFLYTLEKQLVYKENKIKREIRLIDKFTKNTWKYDFFKESGKKVIILSENQRKMLIKRVEKCGKKWSDIEKCLNRKNLKRDLRNGKTFKITKDEISNLCKFLNVSSEYLLYEDVDDKNIQFNTDGQMIKPFYRLNDNFDRFEKTIEHEFLKLNSDEQIIFLDKAEKILLGIKQI